MYRWESQSVWPCSLIVCVSIFPWIQTFRSVLKCIPASMLLNLKIFLCNKTVTKNWVQNETQSHPKRKYDCHRSLFRKTSILKYFSGCILKRNKYRRPIKTLWGNLNEGFYKNLCWILMQMNDQFYMIVCKKCKK